MPGTGLQPLKLENGELLLNYSPVSPLGGRGLYFGDDRFSLIWTDDDSVTLLHELIHHFETRAGIMLGEMAVEAIAKQAYEFLQRNRFFCLMCCFFL